MTKFAAYDDDGIWGVGDTAEIAKERATEFINDNIPESEREGELAKIKTGEISEALAAELSESYDDLDEVCNAKDDFPFVVDENGVLQPAPEDAESEDDDEPETAAAADGDAPSSEDPSTTALQDEQPF